MYLVVINTIDIAYSNVYDRYNMNKSNTGNITSILHFMSYTAYSKTMSKVSKQLIFIK